jgi:hypothetical protein
MSIVFVFLVEGVVYWKNPAGILWVSLERWPGKKQGGGASAGIDVSVAPFRKTRRDKTGYRG